MFNQKMRKWFPVEEAVEGEEVCPLAPLEGGKKLSLNRTSPPFRAKKGERVAHRVFECISCRVTTCGACARDCHEECDKSHLRLKATAADVVCSCVMSGKCAFATVYSQDS